MDALKLVESLNSILWDKLLIFLLCGTGIYYTFKLRNVQMRRFSAGVNQIFGDFTLFGERAGKEGMSSFQAISTAIAAQVGTGNMAGASTAILSGGPGAIFWMWIAAFFGMATIFVEAVLAQHFTARDEDGQLVGGPAYYIDKGLNNKFLAAFFSIAIIIALGFIGNAVQSNSISEAFKTAFDIPTFITGIILAIIAAIVFIGGIGRIASVTEKVVPVMAVIYLIGGLFILISNYFNIIPAFKMIFKGAFNPKAATGGLIGVGVKQAVRYGIARGLFSNEAGMGSTPHAHAVAKVDHPAQQGFVAMFGVFFDTFVVLNMTAFTILVTGCIDPTGIKLEGIQLLQEAFTRSFGNFGSVFIAIALLLFAFSTIIGWYFFGESNIRYLFGAKGLLPYQIVVVIFIFLGSIMDVPLMWELSDFFNGIMVLPNLIALLSLSGVAAKILKEYEDKHYDKTIQS